MKILIVEDNPNNALILHSILNKKGYVCHEALNAEDGIKYILDNVYCLILMDIVLPDDTGINVIKKIRQDKNSKNYTAPIIVITGFCDEASIGNIYSSGANDHIAKPYRRNHIISMIDSWSSSCADDLLYSFAKLLEDNSMNNINDRAKIVDQIKMLYHNIMEFITHDKALRSNDIENIIQDSFVWSDNKKKDAVCLYFFENYCKKFQGYIYEKHDINKILFAIHRIISSVRE